MQADEPATIRPRSQPKMPAGSAVAFYRDTRVDSLESAPKSSVNFTVTSELEDAAQSKIESWIEQITARVFAISEGCHCTT